MNRSDYKGKELTKRDIAHALVEHYPGRFRDVESTQVRVPIWVDHPAHFPD